MGAKKKINELSGVQCRMARTALNLGIRELAAMAMVAPQTISRFESGDELKPRTVIAIKTALEQAGARFFVNNEGEDSVSIKNKE